MWLRAKDAVDLRSVTVECERNNKNNFRLAHGVPR